MQIPYHQGEPKIFLELQAKNGVWIGFIAYVDSGASYSVFQPDIAKTLAIDLKAVAVKAKSKILTLILWR